MSCWELMAVCQMSLQCKESAEECTPMGVENRCGAQTLQSRVQRGGSHIIGNVACCKGFLSFRYMLTCLSIAIMLLGVDHGFSSHGFWSSKMLSGSADSSGMCCWSATERYPMSESCDFASG